MGHGQVPDIGHWYSSKVLAVYKDRKCMELDGGHSILTEFSDACFKGSHTSVKKLFYFVIIF